MRSLGVAWSENISTCAVSATLPEPVVENGSIAKKSPSASSYEALDLMFGISTPAWRTYGSILWPVRFSMGLKPRDVICSSIIAPIWPVLTPGLICRDCLGKGRFGRLDKLAVLP